jgi:RNA recognition motif-containing protein
MRLFVGNLPEQTTEAELSEHFSTLGPLAFIHLPTDRETGRLRGIAFIEYSDPTQGEEAIRRFHNQPFHGKPLIVNQARARETGPGVRNSSSPRPSSTATDWATARRGGEAPPAGKSDARRNFGPDAAPRRQRKPTNRRPQSTDGPKKPMRERHGGQFFGVDEDDADGDTGAEENFNLS